MRQSAPRSSWFTSLARGLSYPWLATAQVRDTFVFLTLLFHYLPGDHAELSLMQKSDQVPAAMLLRACYALDSIMPRAPAPVTFGMFLYVFINCMSCRGQYTLSVLAVKICRQAVLHSSTPSQEGVLLVTSHTRFVLCRPSSRHLGAYAAAFYFRPLHPVSCTRDLVSTVTTTFWS